MLLGNLTKPITVGKEFTFIQSGVVWDKSFNSGYIRTSAGYGIKKPIAQYSVKTCTKLDTYKYEVTAVITEVIDAKACGQS